MAYTEVQVKKNRKYYYRTLSIREGCKFRKSRIYLGADLGKSELKDREFEADLIIDSKKAKKLNPKIALDEIFRTKWIIHHNRSSLVSMLTAGSLFDVFSVGFTPLFGDTYNQLLMVYSHGNTLACIPKTKAEKLGKIALKQLKDNPDIILQNREIFDRKARAMLKFLKEYSARELSAKQMVMVYNKYYKMYNDACLWGEPFPFAVYKDLTEYLENTLKGIKDEKERLRLFSLFITPTEPSFINREDIALSEITEEIRKDKELEKLFKKNIYLVMEGLQHRKEIWLKIQIHQKKYFWISYDYLGNPLDVDFFVKRIKEQLSKSPKSQNLESLKKKQSGEFSRLLSRNILVRKDVELFMAAQQATLLMDYKKELLSQAHYYINLILEKAARISGTPFEELIFARKDELPRILNYKMNTELLKKRKENSAYYFSKKGVCIFTGKKVDRIMDFLEEKKEGPVREISGECASLGTVIGKVRLTRNPSEISRVRKGEILVTGMTTPEYLVGMKKAAAIITNEGGITSHAAIVSRELGIPCIVGTGNATKILKDGDVVELHAGNGVIKIIKSGR